MMAGVDPVRVAAFAVGAAGVVVALWSVVRTARAGRVGADLLAFLAVVGAMAVDEPYAAAMITVMLVTGTTLDARASRRAGRDLRNLVDRQPRWARRRCGDRVETVDVDVITPGDVLVVASGDVIPVDGTLASTGADLDESALTGEPLLRHVGAGAAVTSGGVNAGPPFDLVASATATASTYAGIVEVARGARAASAPMVRLADRAALVLLGVGLSGAAIAWAASGELERAVAVLVVATPCPLILAVPIAVTSGMSRAARRGVIVKGGGTLERLGHVDAVFLDKTGTLTTGRPEVVAVVAGPDTTEDVVLATAAAIGQSSSHVVATAIQATAAARRLVVPRADDVTEVAGSGVDGFVDGRRVRVGQPGWIRADTPTGVRATRLAGHLDGTPVLVELDGEPIGALVLADRPRPEAARTVRRLERAGVRRITMLTGDESGAAGSIGTLVGVERVTAGATPEGKVDAVVAARHDGRVVAMVGDGINDAPALAAADVGVAMGARGGTIATEAADVVIAVDRIDRLAEGIEIARRSARIARQSAVAGLILTSAAMVVAALGWLAPLPGAVTQEAIDLAVILNAVRATRDPRGRTVLQGADADVARRFGDEHDLLRPRLDVLLRLADEVTAPDSDATPARRALHLLRSELLPHELAEGSELYPRLDQVLGGDEATALMARTHVELRRLTDHLAASLDRIPGATPLDAGERTELCRLLYGIHAIFVLHNSQEEEGYFSLVEPSGSGRSALGPSPAPGDDRTEETEWRSTARGGR